MKTIIGYNVYRYADGSSEEFYGFVDTIGEAKELASRGKCLEESMYSTARLAGHCGGISAPDKENEDSEVTEWFGLGYDCAIAVFG